MLDNMNYFPGCNTDFLYCGLNLLNGLLRSAAFLSSMLTSSISSSVSTIYTFRRFSFFKCWMTKALILRDSFASAGSLLISAGSSSRSIIIIKSRRSSNLIAFTIENPTSLRDPIPNVSRVTGNNIISSFARCSASISAQLGSHCPGGS